MSQIDWSKAPEWAGCVITSCASDAERIMYWAEPWGTDGKRCQFGREDRSHRPSEDVADTSGINHSWQLIENRPVAWTGEGLPPVGTVCEFRVEEGDWRQCEVIAHKAETAVCWIHCNKILSTGGASVRQIRTPEQIAAEVRDKAIEDLYFTINWNEGRETWPMISSGRKADYAKAVDAGYRKFEIVDE